MIPSAAPLNPRATTRRSSDSVWPLRDAQGRTWAERQAQNTELTPRHATRPCVARGGANSSSTKGAGQPNKLPGDE